MGIVVVEDLERSDTVAREPTTRAKTIVILTKTIWGGHNVDSLYAGANKPNDRSLTVCFPFHSNTQTSIVRVKVFGF